MRSVNGKNLFSSRSRAYRGFCRGVVTLTTLLILPQTSALASKVQEDPRHLTFSPLDFKPPQTERVILDNGIVLHLMEDHELPLVHVSGLFEAGSIYEPKSRSGLASLTGVMMRAGGTAQMTASEIDEKLEFISGSVETSIGQEEGSISLSVLKKDLDLGLEIFAQVLRYPLFSEKRLELEKARTIESIRRQNDVPSHIASREFNKEIYRGTPYGRYPTVESVQSITRKDLVDFHESFVAPNNLILGISGDFDKKEMVLKIKKIFSGWKRKMVQFPSVAGVRERKKTEILHVFKDTTQTVVRLGHLGIRKKNPDYFPLRVLGHILGSGGFTSRLMKEVRSDRGLAYSVWGYFMPGYREKGTFTSGLATKSETTAEAISIVLDTIKGMREKMVTKEELAIAKESIINSFVFAFDSPEKVVSHRVNIEVHELPEEYLETFRANIEKVTREDILRVARTHLHPDRFAIVVVGHEKGFDKPLSTFGPVRKIELNNKE